jgi:hypothetical protein
MTKFGKTKKLNSPILYFKTSDFHSFKTGKGKEPNMKI